MNFNIKIEWIKRIKDWLNNKNLKKNLNNSIKKTVFLLERDAKLITPVKTWLLRNSYEEEFKDLKWVLYNTRKYWPYVEARVWFLQRTIDNNLYKIEDIFNRWITEFINKI